MSTTINLPGVVNAFNAHLDAVVAAIPDTSRPSLFLMGAPLREADQFVRVVRMRYNQQRRTTTIDVHKAELNVELAVGIAAGVAQTSYLKLHELISRLMLELECKPLTLADHELAIVAVPSAEIVPADEEPQTLLALLNITVHAQRLSGNSIGNF